MVVASGAARRQISVTSSSVSTAEAVAGLAEGTCRWPIGNPGHAGFHFCGAPRSSNRTVRTIGPMPTWRRCLATGRAPLWARQPWMAIAIREAADNGTNPCQQAC